VDTWQDLPSGFQGSGAQPVHPGHPVQEWVDIRGRGGACGCQAVAIRVPGLQTRGGASSTLVLWSSLWICHHLGLLGGRPLFLLLDHSSVPKACLSRIALDDAEEFSGTNNLKMGHCWRPVTEEKLIHTGVKAVHCEGLNLGSRSLFDKQTLSNL